MTQIGYGPLERIDGPLPNPPVYGLLPAAEAPAAGVRIVVDVDGQPFDLNDLSSIGETMQEAIARMKREGTLPPQAGQERWLNGAEVYPFPPDHGDLFDTCSPGTATSGVKGVGAELNHPQFSAVTGYLAEHCKSYKVWDQDQFKARGVTAYRAIESSLLGRVLMRGEGVPLNPHLADGNGTFPNGNTVTSAVNALAILENEIAASGKLGLIHASPGFVTTLAGRFVVDNKTGVVRTINGNVIIPDPGYAAGSTPVGRPAPTGTQEWIYATGAIDIRRSEIFTLPETAAEALDRGTPDSATTGRPNTYIYRVERYYLIDWDTEVQAAVLADRCQAAC